MGTASLPLAGCHALVTGAGRGIGEAVARRLAAMGARLSLLGRRAEALQALADDLGPATNGPHLALPCDVAAPA